MKECCECCLKHEVTCPVEDCNNWIDYGDDLNCVLITLDKHGRLTLRETADRLGISFVRVKQIQDRALEKLQLKEVQIIDY